MNFINNNDNTFQQIQQQGQNVTVVQGYTPDGRPIMAEVYNPMPYQPPVQVIQQPVVQQPVQQQVVVQQQQPTQNKFSLGANFSGLIDSNVTVPRNPLNQVVTTTASAEKKKKSKKKKKDDEESTELAVPDNKSVDHVNSREIVENTVYQDSYIDTNMMTYGIINQTDELLRDCKMELDYIRSQRNLKGKYHYINDTVSSMGTLLSTKLAAIKEINNTIKTVNDNEYRRFKDMRAMDNTDDNKTIMDAYTAFISAPVGAPKYELPGTANLTSGMNGVVQANYPNDVQANMDVGMANYLAHLSPEENLMLNDSNKDIEEVIVYDQATGAKYFQWMNTVTGAMIPNMPVSSTLTVEDYNIDPRTKLAKNTNLNDIKKVVVLNEGAFDKF